tara:strand:- start:23 stop:538 length:516 start_codon:yes stop_codon:yes gene_type:complete
MDLTKVLETIVSNLPPTATVTINVAQPGAPIYNCIGGAQFIGNNPTSRRKSKKSEETESPDAIAFDLDTEDTEEATPTVNEDVVLSQSGLSTSDEESAVVTQESTVDIDALIDEAIKDKGLEVDDSASVELWAAKDPTKLQDAVILAADELDADDGVDDIYTCLKNAGWSK